MNAKIFALKLKTLKTIYLASGNSKSKDHFKIKMKSINTK